MNNISVLHIIVTDAVAGAEKYLRHLLPALQDKGVNCKLLLICPPGFSESFASYISDLNANGIQLSKKTTLIIFIRTYYAQTF